MFFRIGLIALLLYGSMAYAEPVSIPDVVNVKASLRHTPPDWAVMERKLIDVMENEAAPFYIKNFTRPDGQTYKDGQWDDVYEMFQNWGLLYAIGGNEKLFKWALKEYNAITDQNTVYYLEQRDEFHQLYKEFVQADDYFHIGEAMQLFYGLALADPAIPENIDRAKRFAGFYLGEDPEAASIYDPRIKMIRSISTGSKGAPDFSGSTLLGWPGGAQGEGHRGVEFMGPTGMGPGMGESAGWALLNNAASLSPVVKKLDEGWEKDPVKREKIYKIFDKVVRQCDIPLNLSSTALVTNAYLYTGDEKYKKWVLEYVDAWLQRIKDNNGIIPDNIGRSGKIGEYRNGQFWGGMFGWYPRGYLTDFGFGALSVASECAYLVSGDPKYLNLIRSQLDVLMENAKTSPEGEMLVPHTYGPDGWGNFAPMNIREYAHLWHASMDPQDWARIEKVKKNAKLDWKNVPVIRDRVGGPSENARLMYYAGEKPDWPYEALNADYQWVINQMEYLLNTDIKKIDQDWLHYSSPIAVKALQQVTMGTPQIIYNGGLLRATVRYYDMDKIRPGLPQDVAALVTGLDAGRAVIELVNMSTLYTRKLIVQAGAFGEHNFTNVNYKDNVIVSWPEKITGQIRKEAKDCIAQVNGKYFSVEMPPGTAITLDIGMQRFVNKPSYAFPWHSGSVPQK